MSRAALLPLLLLGCASAPAAKPTPLPALAAPSTPPHLSVSLGAAAPGSGCDQLLIDGRPGDLPTLAKVAHDAAVQNPDLQASVSTLPTCTTGDVAKVTGTLNHAGIHKVMLSTAAKSPDEPAADVRAAAQGANTFALGLYKQLRGEPGNLFFSPLSVAAALALVDVGAAGQTAKDLDAALGAGMPHADVHRALAELIRGYTAGKSGVTLEVANRIWAAQSLPIEPSYAASVQAEFGAAFEQADFAQTEKARARINAWVSEKTHGKISELIGRGVLRPDTEIVLANAVYFLGTWQRPFDPADTHDAPFTLISGEKATAPMMHLRLKAKAAQVQDLQVVELPYGNAGIVFDLLLPTEPTGLPKLEAALTPAALEETFAALKRSEVTLAMPRFTERSQFELAKPLAALGLADLFATPDLSAMTRARVHISAVVHQAFVDVNEKGTEAAAATGMMGTRSLQRLPHLTVTADHPFLFLIRDTATGGILFLGRLEDPRH